MVDYRKDVGISSLERYLPEGIIKRCNRDFIVCEIAPIGLISLLDKTDSIIDKSHSSSNGKYTLFNMTKEGITTLDAITEISRQLRVASNEISFYGMKDKWAITAQLIAIKSTSLCQSIDFLHGKISLKKVGYSKKPLFWGGNKGNFFQIRVLTTSQWPDLTKINLVPNFFGYQRFGGYSGNKFVGELLLMGRFEDAASEICYIPSRAKFEDVLWECKGNFRSAFLHHMMLKETKFFILQWQSYLFNKLLSLMVLDGKKNQSKIPLWHPNNKNLYRDVWVYDGYFDKAIVSLLVRTKRASFFVPHNFKFSNTMNNEVLFEFEIPSGSYATTVLSQMYSLCEIKHGG